MHLRRNFVRWPFWLVLLALASPCRAQLNLKDLLRIDARIGRLSYGQGDVVRESEKDKGNLFDGLDIGVSASLFVAPREHRTFHSELGMSYAKQTFQLPCNCPQTQDQVIVLENDLSWAAVESMASIGYRTGNENYWYGMAGLGWSYRLFSNREVRYNVDFLDSRPDSSGTIEPQGKYDLRTGGGWPLGFTWEVSLGHLFASPSLPLFAEAYYRADLTAWKYEVEYFQGLKQELTLKRAAFGVRVSVKF